MIGVLNARSFAALSMGALAVVSGCRGDDKIGVYNAAPSVSIQSPSDGAEFNEGELVDFVGMVSDDQTSDEALLIQWSSDIDGLLTDTDPALNIVMKTTHADGHPTVKLSDHAGKQSGPREQIARYQREYFAIPEHS